MSLFKLHIVSDVHRHIKERTCTSTKRSKLQNMHNGDVLGDEGRKALDACVKVKIFGKPETRRYVRDKALRRLQGCHDQKGWPIGLRFMSVRPDQCMLGAESGNRERTYDIVDINNELVKFDDMNYVDKYPKEGAGSDKLRDLIDKRRADVERELEEATNDPMDDTDIPGLLHSAE
ncbi:hypothetical protein OS493_039742 [Desmophyllum pertusum]|uniref:Uncharacterized protein n=1 Tax=Desmophyllum pertusum TaxID=174260 RepID=A0A9W9ZVT6_9CNID|nr:hypothetical protein OS493_039742 [Desmophyllum pertusum]